MCLEAKKIIKSRDVVFMKDSGSIKNDLEMHPSGRNEGPKVVVVDKSSKSPLFDGSGQYVDGNEQVGGNGNDIEESHEGPANDHVIVEGFGKERRPLGEWWKNHILPQHDEERANVAIFEGLLSWNEAMTYNMQKLMGSARNSLYKNEKLWNSTVLQVFDYLQSGSVEGGALDC